MRRAILIFVVCVILQGCPVPQPRDTQPPENIKTLKAELEKYKKEAQEYKKLYESAKEKIEAQKKEITGYKKRIDGLEKELAQREAKRERDVFNKRMKFIIDVFDRSSDQMRLTDLFPILLTREHICRDFIKKYPNLSEGYFYLSLICFKTERLKEALDSINKAIELEKKTPNPNHYFLRGQIKLEKAFRVRAGTTRLPIKGFPTLKQEDELLSSACLDFKSVIKLMEKLPRLCRYYLLFSSKKYEEVVKIAEKLEKEEDIPNTWEVLRLKGEALARLNRFEDALKSLNSAIKSKRNYYQVHFLLGYLKLTLAAMGKKPAEMYRNAFNHLSRAIHYNPKFVLSFAYRAILCRRLAEFQKAQNQDPTQWLDQAQKDCKEVLKELPDYPYIYNIKGLTHLSLARWNITKKASPKTDFDNAVENFSTAIKLKPDFADAYNNRGLTYYEIGRWKRQRKQPCIKELENSFEDFAQAIKIDPDLVEAYVNRGIAHGMMADIKIGQKKDPASEITSALNDLTEAIKREPKRALTYIERGRIHHMMMRWEISQDKDPSTSFRRARENFGQALEVSPAMFSAYYNRAIIRIDFADWMMNKNKNPREVLKNAITDLDEALKINKNDYNANLNQGYAYFLLAKWGFGKQQDISEPLDKAIKLYTSALKIQPNIAVHDLRAEAYNLKARYKIIKKQDATSELEKQITDLDIIIKAKPANVDIYHIKRAFAYYTIAESKKDKKLYKQAVNDFENAFRINPALKKSHQKIYEDTLKKSR